MTDGNSIAAATKGPVLKIRTKSLTVDDFVARHARDFSAEGVFVMTKHPLELGAPCGIEFQLVDEQPVFVCKGTVAWRREASDDPQRAAGMGVAFTRLRDDGAALIERMNRQRGSTPSRFEEPGASPGSPAARTTPQAAAAPATRGLWSAAGTTPVPTVRPQAPAGQPTGGGLRASELFSSPDLGAPTRASAAVEVAAPVGEQAEIRAPVPSFDELERVSEPVLSESPDGARGEGPVNTDPDVLQLPGQPSSRGGARDAPGRSSDPARAERFSRMIRALRAASTPPDEPAPYGGALLAAVVLSFGLIAFVLYLFGTGSFASVIETFTRGIRAFLAAVGL